MLSQRGPCIFLPEYPPPLQLRNHPADEILDPAWDGWEHDVEAVAGIAFQPVLHFIGDGFGAAGEGQAAIAAECYGQLPHGQVFAACAFQHALTAALALIGFRDVG